MDTGEIKPLNPSLPPRPGTYRDAERRRRPARPEDEPAERKRREPPSPRTIDEYAK